MPDPNTPTPEEELGTGEIENEDPGQGEAPSTGEESFLDGIIPPEQQSAFRQTKEYKQMQAAFTKKTQELARIRNQAAQDAYEANLFRQLVQDPKIQKALQQDSSESETEVGEGSGAVPPNEQVLRQLQALQERVLQQEVQREKEAFIAAHPDYEKYAEGMKKAWRGNENLSMEAAYMQAVGEIALRNRQTKEKGKTPPPVEKGGTNRPSKSGAGKVETFEDAAAAAMDELGMSRRDLTR